MGLRVVGPKTRTPASPGGNGEDSHPRSALLFTCPEIFNLTWIVSESVRLRLKLIENRNPPPSHTLPIPQSLATSVSQICNGCCPATAGGRHSSTSKPQAAERIDRLHMEVISYTSWIKYTNYT